MTSVASGVRAFVSAFLGILAAFLLLIAIWLPFGLNGQAAQDLAFYQQFQQAAVYADRYAAEHQGLLPSDENLQSLGDTSDAKSIWASLSATSVELCGDFRSEAGDRFTLWFWRGEWGECFAYPSGKTTLPMSVSAYLRSGLGTAWLIWFLTAIAAGYGALRLGRRRFSEGD